jgi:hypothetical protein
LFPIKHDGSDLKIVALSDILGYIPSKPEYRHYIQLKHLPNPPMNPAGSAGYHKPTPYSNTHNIPKPKTQPCPKSDPISTPRPHPQPSTKIPIKRKWEPFGQLDPIPRLLAFKALAPSYKNIETALEALTLTPFSREDLWSRIQDIRLWTVGDRRTLKKAIRNTEFAVHPDRNGMFECG